MIGIIISNMDTFGGFPKWIDSPFSRKEILHFVESWSVAAVVM